MVTLIPVVFGAGKWIASLPTGYLLDRFGRSLMIWGLLLIAIIDLASIMTSSYSVFLSFRALGGVGWAMFATVATTAMVSVPAVRRRGRAVSLLLMSETAGLLLGSAVGGWLYQGVGAVRMPALGWGDWQVSKQTWLAWQQSWLRFPTTSWFTGRTPFACLNVSSLSVVPSGARAPE
jgi:MFS family permease